MKQKFIIHIISIDAMIALMTSCASGKIILSNDANISKYKYEKISINFNGGDPYVSVCHSMCRENNS